MVYIHNTCDWYSMWVSFITDVFLPSPDSLLVNLKESKDVGFYLYTPGVLKEHPPTVAACYCSADSADSAGRPTGHVCRDFSHTECPWSRHTSG